jgi:gas vesicle protein
MDGDKRLEPLTTSAWERASNAEKVDKDANPARGASVHFQANHRFGGLLQERRRVWYAQAFFGLSEGRVFVMAEESKINGFAWFLAGLGIGALTGVLYAPKSGRETREDLAASAREGTEYLRTRSKQVAEQVGGLVDKGKDQMGEYVDRGREVVDRGRAQWEEFVERGKSLVGDQSAKVTAAVDAGRQAYKSTSESGS